ncbi:hypothetical protein [Alkalihalobacillus sp. BA299]|uniref:hypothetical protein n=1 Tax=Alkalihalobacillus sp. BA299 TaxID=2815938 RepID=UPI001ADBD316|nr:hypothetical protein [Alkalihalobacillus sp. BA299]
MKKLSFLFISLVTATLIVTGCGEEAKIEKVDNETQASEEKETNWLEEKESLTAEEQMIKSFVQDFFSADADLREQAVDNYIHPDVQDFFYLMSGFSDENDITTIDMNQFSVIESVQHEEDGEKGIITLTREQSEAGSIHERIFFVLDDKIGWFFSPITEDEDMRQAFYDMRALLSSETPPEEILETFEPEQEVEADSSDNKEKDIGTRANPLTIGERITLNYYDWLHGQVHLEMEFQEVISGDEAWNMVREGNQFNEEPADDQEYILAKFYVKVLEVEEEPFDLHQALFDAVSSAGNTYDDFISVSGVEPSLSNEMYAGAEREGYTYFLVDKNDDNPLAAFQRRTDAEVWFKLRD